MRGELTALLLVVMTGASAHAQDAPSMPQLLLGRRLTVGVGGYGSGYYFRGGSWGDGFTTQFADVRWRWGGFTLEGGLVSTVPVFTAGALYSPAAHLRVGWTWSRATVTVGARSEYAGTPEAKLQWLPTLSAAYAFDRFGLSAGVFDMQGIPIARVSLEHPHFGVGYVFLLGLEARGRIRVSRAVSLQLQALAFRAFTAQVAYLSISGTFDADAAGWGAGP